MTTLTERPAAGEIVAASYTEFTAESYALNETPLLGSLVRAEMVVGMVHDARTESIGLTAREGQPNDGDGEVYKLHPEFSYTLHTRFSAMAVGYYRDGNIVHTYPDTLPRLYYKCYPLDDAATLQFTAKPGYLRALLCADSTCVDQAVAYLLTRIYHLRGNDRTHLLAATTFLGRLLKGQYDRLLAILETLEGMLGDSYTDNGVAVRGLGRIDY